MHSPRPSRYAFGQDIRIFQRISFRMNMTWHQGKEGLQKLNSSQTS